MVKIRIKSWEELEEIAIKKHNDGDLQMDSDSFRKEMAYLCNTTHVVDLSQDKIYINAWHITPEMYEVIELSLIEVICEKLGVEVGEEWETEDGYYYRINENGTLSHCGRTDNKWFEVEDWFDILTGRLKPKWKPKYGETYITPELDNHIKYSSHTWYNSVRDYLLMRRGLVFKTQEEAIKCTNKMIKSIKEV